MTVLCFSVWWTCIQTINCFFCYIHYALSCVYLLSRLYSFTLNHVCFMSNRSIWQMHKYIEIYWQKSSFACHFSINASPKSPKRSIMSSCSNVNVVLPAMRTCAMAPSPPSLWARTSTRYSPSFMGRSMDCFTVVYSMPLGCPSILYRTWVRTAQHQELTEPTRFTHTAL